MLSVNRGQRYFVYHGTTDMRNGFDGLCGLVRSRFLQDPLHGDVFIFLNRHRNRIKFLQWQGDGFAIYYKRLEKGTYELPEVKNASASIEITTQQLLLIMEGISLLSVKKRARYEHHFVDKKSITSIDAAGI